MLDEVNEEQQTGYKLSDVYFEFNHEIMSNALENSQIEQNIATARQTEINTLLNLENNLDDKMILKKICEVMDIEYDEIQREETENIEDVEKVLEDEAQKEDVAQI